jgi:hypothetical protein
MKMREETTGSKLTPLTLFSFSFWSLIQETKVKLPSSALC